MTLETAELRHQPPPRRVQGVYAGAAARRVFGRANTVLELYGFSVVKRALRRPQPTAPDTSQ